MSGLLYLEPLPNQQFDEVQQIGFRLYEINCYDVRFDLHDCWPDLSWVFKEYYASRCIILPWHHIQVSWICRVPNQVVLGITMAVLLTEITSLVHSHNSTRMHLQELPKYFCFNVSTISSTICSVIKRNFKYMDLRFILHLASHVERLWNIAGNIMNHKRRSMAPHLLGSLLFLRINSQYRDASLVPKAISQVHGEHSERLWGGHQAHFHSTTNEFSWFQ